MIINSILCECTYYIKVKLHMQCASLPVGYRVKCMLTLT